MEEYGYTGSISEFCGVRRDYKRRNDWTFDSLEQVLKNFQRYLNKEKKGGGMFALVGEVCEVYQERIGDPFEEHCTDEVIALFTNLSAAKEYIEKSKLKKPKRDSFSPVYPFRSNSLLSRCSSAWVEDYEDPEYLINPKI